MENYSFLNSFINNLKIASVFILDTNGIILKTNEGVEKSFGYKTNDLIGIYFGELFCAEDRETRKPEYELATVLEKGEATDFNYLLHKSGAKIWVNGESVLARTEAGEKFIIKIVYDTNEQKVLEEFLFKKNELLVKTNNDLNTFVYTASHDLKAPISNIEALVVYLKEELTEGQGMSDKVNTIIKMMDISIEKFKLTLEDLTITGKHVAEDLDNQRISYFHEVFEDVKSNLYEMTQKYQPILSEDFSRAPYLHFSRKNLRSILQNLFSNAMKFSSTSRRPEIEIRTFKEGGNIVLTFCDNGLGIQPEDQDKIFNIYERAHDHIEGTGVGLNIIQRIIDNAGGKIEVESRPGEGTTFTIHFKHEKLPILP